MRDKLITLAVSALIAAAMLLVAIALAAAIWWLAGAR